MRLGIFLLVILTLLSSETFAGPVDEEDKEVMEKALENLADSGIIESSLGLGDKTEDFSLPDAFGNIVTLSEELKNGPVILTFYRGSWCPFCNAQLAQLQKKVDEFRAYNAQLIAISPEKPNYAQLAVTKHKLTFTVLSDDGNTVAKRYGISFKLAEALKPIYQKFAIDLPEHNTDNSYDLPVPATYVIRKDGVIVYAFKDVDYKKRADPEEILEALKKL